MLLRLPRASVLSRQFKFKLIELSWQSRSSEADHHDDHRVMTRMALASGHVVTIYATDS